MKLVGLWIQILLLPGLLGLLQPAALAAEGAKKVLVIMDEKPAMENLAKYMKNKAGVESTIVDQKSLPADFSPFDAVIMYVHAFLAEPTELKIIDYTNKGGRYVCIHHSISSAKAKNKYYFDFLGVRLDGLDQNKEPTTPGEHYAWVHPVELSAVNLRPSHYIVSHDVVWPEKVKYTSSDEPSVEAEYAAMTLKDTEAYMNHKFTDGREKTVLAGIKFLDARNNQLFMQDRAIWTKPAGKGTIVYISQGHTAAEFNNATFAQLVLNAVLWDGSN